ncbi:hypothetical protein T484DRAFT_2758301 [Baffinella frigidus]|nr:hypothetical protein T484DRAFT_2758301 [Cryptophyta sp. CCMP2293]
MDAAPRPGWKRNTLQITTLKPTTSGAGGDGTPGRGSISSRGATAVAPLRGATAGGNATPGSVGKVLGHP